MPITPDRRFPLSAQHAYIVRGEHAAPLGVHDGDVLVAVAGAPWREGDVVLVRRTRDGAEEVTARRVEPGSQIDGDVFARVIIAHRVF